MTMAIDLRVPQRPTTRIQWLKAYVAVILSGVMIVGTVGTLIYMGNKLSPSRDVAGHP